MEVPALLCSILRSRRGPVFALVTILPVLSPVPAVRAGDPPPPLLEFAEPSNGALFSTLDEIPVVLHAAAPSDVFHSAEVFANRGTIATTLFCCPLCPCARPQPGQATTLQIPAPWSGGPPPPQPWQGWRNSQAGVYQLTARAVGENGTVVDAAPVTITIVDLTLNLVVNPDGSAILVIPQGSMVPGGYDLETSDNLLTWKREGPFSPGNVAAFYWDDPPENARRKRYYRAKYVPPSPD
ncbi:MAG: hypothetical protein O3C21_10670 [Verrucomicrobia bacterium]|nr:hypothetical protein [Verrucomicrobiota bacterium]